MTERLNRDRGNEREILTERLTERESQNWIMRLNGQREIDRDIPTDRENG